jgi:tight adherence protein C
MNITLILVVVLLVVVAVAVALVIIGRRNPEKSDEEALTKRLEEFTQRGETVSLEKIEMAQPLTERVIYPMARKLGEVAIKFTPENALKATAKKLELAGMPPSLDPTMFLAAQFVVAVIFAGLLLLIFSFAQVSISIGQKLGVVAIFTILGFYFPSLYLTSKIQRRQKEVRKAMPDALDLLTICVEAGLGFEAAMAKVSEKWENELSLAFARIIQEVGLGKLRRDAMRDMSERIGIPEMTSFVAAIIQSELLGVSMAKVLRIQSEQMRIKRRQYAEEEAHKAPIKMLIPMGLLIFPSIMIVLLGPAAIKLMHSALGGIFFPAK